MRRFHRCPVRATGTGTAERRKVRRGVANAEHRVRGDGAAGSGDRTGVVRAALWLVAAVLAVRQTATVLGRPPGQRFTEPETWTGPGGVLRMTGSLYDGDRFTGTPFAGLVLRTPARFAEQHLGLVWTFGSLLLVAALGVVAARALPGPVSRRTALLAAPVAISLLMVSLPVRTALHLGQTGVLPVLLVLLGCFAARGEHARGVLIGVAAALQPTVLLFAVLLGLTGRRRAAATGGLAFAGCTALAWAVRPGDSWAYWVHHVAGAGLGGDAADLANQSLHGALLRFGLTGPAEVALLLVLAGAVCVLGLRRAVRYARDGQLLLAVAVTGCVAVAVSPTTWPYQLLWVLLAVVGRVGKRAGDRRLWPVVVVLVLTLPGTMLLPNLAVLVPVRDNVPLLAALAAACAVPFLPRASPYWRDPVPTVYAAPAPARRWARRVLSRPNLLLELLLIRVVYSAYAQVRLAATAGRDTAERHGRQIHAVERWLHIDIEHWANRTVAGIAPLRGFFDFYYSTFHFIVPLTILGVLYVRRPAEYRWARGTIGFATLVALVGFWLYPLAPPRLMPGLGFVDTVHGVQDLARPDYGSLTAVTNQYAAMPSLHFGWSLWCGVVVVLLAPRGWMKALGLLHPLLTVCAIVATANHWVLDAVGGAVVVGLGFALARLLTGGRGPDPAAVVPGAARPWEDRTRPVATVPVPRPPDGAPARGVRRG
ncbi:bifunctional glycosyltransferase 87/phosphatase PAP2 family protein [Streptomyces sp. NPDC052095]|uniref:bifunctional glycosyltransferase 87/phosphatase PAP2 family protein n=1 Tax=unclassified Streptomyces TaxID=2593676 RepID=UPI00344EC321